MPETFLREASALFPPTHCPLLSYFPNHKLTHQLISNAKNFFHPNIQRVQLYVLISARLSFSQLARPLITDAAGEKSEGHNLELQPLSDASTTLA